MPNVMPLCQESHIQISFDHENNWLYADWIGDQNMETIRDGCERILKFMRSEICTKILNDNTHVTNIWSDVSDWVAKDWFPRLSASGLYYVAWVLSPNTFSRLSAEKTLKHELHNIVVLPFEEINAAKAWLQSV